MATKDITDKQVLEAYVAYLRDGRWPYEHLMETTGQPEKVCYSAMERAAKRGLIEYGISLRTGWLTDKGREFLAGTVE